MRLDSAGMPGSLLMVSLMFVARLQNVVLRGFAGSGKSYLGCAIAKRACEHRIRAALRPHARPRGSLGSSPRHPRRVREVPAQICGIHPAGH